MKIDEFQGSSKKVDDVQLVYMLTIFLTFKLNKLAVLYYCLQMRSYLFSAQVCHKNLIMWHLCQQAQTVCNQFYTLLLYQWSLSYIKGLFTLSDFLLLQFRLHLPYKYSQSIDLFSLRADFDCPHTIVP